MYARACLIATNARPQNRMSTVREACRVQPRSGRPRSAISAEVAGARKKKARRVGAAARPQQKQTREDRPPGPRKVRGVAGIAPQTLALLILAPLPPLRG